MTTPDLLASLPKVELHVHLEGSISSATASRLAERHGEDAATAMPLVDGAYPPRFADFGEFVRLYLAVTKQLRTPDDLRFIAAEFARAQAAQNVRYSEVTFTATTLEANGMAASDLWPALLEGFAEADTEIAVIIDAVRNLGPNSGHRTVELAAEAIAAGVPVAGLGLAGDENSLPASAFPMLRAGADDLGIGLAVHAGETGPADHVRAALDDLGADRIGHGVAVADDTALLQRLVAEGVVLEVCPTSNVTLQVFDSLDVHPLPRLWESGANVTINSDDPPFFGTTLTGELGHAARLADLAPSDLATLQRRAIDGAFCPAPLRQRLHAEVSAWLAACTP